MDYYKAIEALWPVFVILLAGFAWLIRIESKVLYQDEKIKLMQAEKIKVWEKLDTFGTFLNDIKNTLARMEGRAEGKHP